MNSPPFAVKEFLSKRPAFFLMRPFFFFLSRYFVVLNELVVFSVNFLPFLQTNTQEKQANMDFVFLPLPVVLPPFSLYVLVLGGSIGFLPGGLSFAFITEPFPPSIPLGNLAPFFLNPPPLSSLPSRFPPSSDALPSQILATLWGATTRDSLHLILFVVFDLSYLRVVLSSFAQPMTANLTRRASSSAFCRFLSFSPHLCGPFIVAPPPAPGDDSQTHTKIELSHRKRSRRHGSY